MDAAVAVPPCAIDLASEHPFRVGGASIDPASRDATFNGTIERLQPQNLKVLVALAHRRGKVVTRDELVDLCWDGRFVGDDVINRAISTLRQFAERAGGFGIETVPRSGYRLVERTGSVRGSQLMIGASAIVCALAALAAVLILLRTGQRAPTTLAVALLPFDSSTTDPTIRAIAFAAHDSVSHALSLSRYAVTEIEADARGGPTTNFVMSGDVSGTPDKLIATVRMEEAAHHIIVYSHRFEVPRDQAWALVERIGPQVAGSLGWTEPVLLIDRKHPSDPEILKEKLGEGATLETTRRLAMRAPDSAVAQMTLAFSAGFALSDLPREKRAEAVADGRRATDRATALAPEFGGVYIPWCLLHSSARLVECEDRLRAAAVRDPDSPWVDHFLANELVDVGRTGEAAELANHSLSNDPFAPAKIALAVRTLEATGQRSDAEKLYGQGRRWWLDTDDLFSARVHGLAYRGDFDALARFENEVGPANLAKWYERLGVLPAAVKARNVAGAKKTCPLSQKLSFRSDVCMLVLAELGDTDDAFALAELLYSDRVGRSPADQERPSSTAHGCPAQTFSWDPQLRRCAATGASSSSLAALAFSPTGEPAACRTSVRKGMSRSARASPAANE